MVPGEVRGVVKAMLGFSQTLGLAARTDFHIPLRCIEILLQSRWTFHEHC